MLKRGMAIKKLQYWEKRGEAASKKVLILKKKVAVPQ